MQEHSTTKSLQASALTKKIQQRLIQESWLSVHDYMQLVLYDPEYGYYTTGRATFDKNGDFITAPVISPLFAECIAVQFCQIQQKLPQAAIAELGAGCGQLAVDLLLTLQTRNALPTVYWIYEFSPALRQRQQEKLAQKGVLALTQVMWLEDLNQLKNFSGLLLANEVFDAMPVRRYRYRTQGVDEQGLVLNAPESEWQLAWRPVSDPQIIATITALAAQHQWPENYVAERRADVLAWLQTLSNKLMQGVFLCLDYGYTASEFYHPQRTDGTLLAYYQHQVVHDFIRNPGLMDLTAHVNFSELAELGSAAHWKVSGFTQQAYFLLNCGLAERLSQKNQELMHEPWQQYQLANGVKRLTLPTEMGELIKVIAFTRNFDLPLVGFKAFDKRHCL